MLFRDILAAAALASTASAGVVIVTSTTILTSFTNQDEASKVESKLESALSTYITGVTGNAQYQSYTSALGEYLATRTDAPASLILNPSVISTLTTAPAWYTGMPSDLKQFGESIVSEEIKIAESIVKEGVAAKPTGVAGIIGAGMAAAAAGAAIFL